jgi:hypothetical protein
VRDSTPVRCRRRSVAAYWPITTEYWIPGRMTRCKACHLIKQRLDKRIRRTDEEKRALDVERVRQWRGKNKERHREYIRKYRAANLERVRAIDRESYYRHRDARLAAMRERRKAA